MVRHPGGWRSVPIGLVCHKSFFDLDLRRTLWPRPTKGGPSLAAKGGPSLAASNKGWPLPDALKDVIKSRAQKRFLGV